MSFAWPLMLWSLLLVPALLALYLLAQRRRRAYAVRFTNLALLRQVAGRSPGLRRHLPPLFFLLGLAALLVSLARPSAVIAVPRDQASVVLVMDVSGSMAAGDLRPTRLAAAQQAAHTFVHALPSEAQVGLVSFSSTASVNMPLTHDVSQVDRAIDGLRANGGTAIGDGLNAAVDLLTRQAADPQSGPVPSTIVLLSDGESSLGAPPAEAANRAHAAGITVYTVGVGERGVQARINARQTVGLDERTLQQIARDTGGEYFYAAESTDLQQIYQKLGSQVRWVEERTEVTALVGGLGSLLFVLGALVSLRWFNVLP